MAYPQWFVKQFLIGKGMDPYDADQFSKLDWVQNFDRSTAPKGVTLNGETIAKWKQDAKQAGLPLTEYAQQKLAPQTITTAAATTPPPLPERRPDIAQPTAPTSQIAGGAPTLPQNAAQLRSLASSVGADFVTPRSDVAAALTPPPPVGRELDQPVLPTDAGFQQAPKIGGQGLAFNPGGTVGAWWTPERVQQGYDTLRAGGVSDLGAQALLARWAGVEAPAGPTASNKIGGGHWGIGQWGKARGGQAMSSADYQTQLDHVVTELQGPESAALKKLNAATTPREAAIGAASYERAGGYNPRTGADAFVNKTLGAMDRFVPGAGENLFANVEQADAGITPAAWVTGNEPTYLPGPTPSTEPSPTTYPAPPPAPTLAAPSMMQAPLEPALSGGNMLGAPTSPPLPTPKPAGPSGPAGTVPIGANTYLPQSLQTMSSINQPPMSMMPTNLPPLGGAPKIPTGISVAQGGPSFADPNMPTADFGTNPIFGTGLPPTPGAPQIAGAAPPLPTPKPDMFPMAQVPGLPTANPVRTGAYTLGAPPRPASLYGYGPANPTGAGTYDTRGSGPVVPNPVTGRAPGSSAIPGNMGIASGTPPSAVYGHGVAAPIVQGLFKGGGIFHGPGGIGLVEQRMRNMVGPGAYGMNVGFGGGF